MVAIYLICHAFLDSITDPNRTFAMDRVEAGDRSCSRGVRTQSFSQLYGHLKSTGYDSDTYVIVGFLALLLYVPLAITSTRGWQRRLKRHWQTLHKSIYLIAILVMLHYTWLKKVGFMETLPWCVLLLGLFGVRIYNKYYKNN